MKGYPDCWYYALFPRAFHHQGFSASGFQIFQTIVSIPETDFHCLISTHLIPSGRHAGEITRLPFPSVSTAGE
jgi:hypothetical protein